jgi:hypothetical protein
MIKKGKTGANVMALHSCIKIRINRVTNQLMIMIRAGNDFH